MNSYTQLFSRGSTYILDAKYNWIVRLDKLIDFWFKADYSDTEKDRLYIIGLLLYNRLNTVDGLLNVCKENSDLVNDNGICAMLADIGICLSA